MRHKTESLLWNFYKQYRDASVSDWVSLGGWLAGLLFLIWLSFRIRSWLRDDEGPAASEHRMLSEMGKLHRQGDLSEEEYRFIKGQLVGKIDDIVREQEALEKQNDID